MTTITLAPYEVFSSDPRGRDGVLVRTSRGEFVSVSKQLVEVMRVVDGLSGPQAADRLSAALGTTVTAADVSRIVEDYLRPNGLLAETSEPTAPSMSFSRHWRVLGRRQATGAARWLAWLYWPPIPWAVALLFGVATAVLVVLGLATPTPFADLAVANTIWIATASFVFHEFGHAAAAAHYGCETRGLGVGVYLTRPVLFADLTETWRLTRRQRVVTDLGGVYFQAILQLPLAAVAIVTRNATLVATFEMITLTMVMNLNPFLRMDGYWVIVDYFRLTNVRRSALDGFKALRRNAGPAGGELGRRAAFLYSVGYIGTSAVFLMFGLSQLPGAVQRLVQTFQQGWIVGGDNTASLAERMSAVLNDLIVPALVVAYVCVLTYSAARRLRLSPLSRYRRRTTA